MPYLNLAGIPSLLGTSAHFGMRRGERAGPCPMVRALLAWGWPHLAEKQALRLVLGVTMNNLKWFKPWKCHRMWSLRMLWCRRCWGVQRWQPDVATSVHLVPPLPLSPLSGLNLRPKQCQKSWNRKVFAFIIRNSLSPLSGLGIFNI